MTKAERATLYASFWGMLFLLSVSAVKHDATQMEKVIAVFIALVVTVHLVRKLYFTFTERP